HHHLQVRKAVGGKQRKIVHDAPPKNVPVISRSEPTEGSWPTAPARGVMPAPAGLLFAIPPISHHHSRALPERNLRLRPSHTCGQLPSGSHRHRRHARRGSRRHRPRHPLKGEVGLGLHGAAPPHGPASWPPVQCYAQGGRWEHNGNKRKI